MPGQTHPAPSRWFSDCRPSRSLGLCAALLGASVLASGCASIVDESASAGAGIVGAGIAGSVTDNGGVAAGIGLGVNAAASAGVKSLEKHVHRAEQDVIAATAGPLEVGAVANWSIRRKISTERSEHGELTVSRVIRAGQLDCKEVVFSVDRVRKSKPERAFYTTTVCRDGAVWKWATAEPSTERWGGLQ